MSYRKGSPDEWRKWANSVLDNAEKYGWAEEEVGETYFRSYFDECSPLRGTIQERALYAYLLAEAGEPF